MGAELHLLAARVPPWQRDYVFHPTRKWELDFAWPELRVYLSIEGGVGKSSHRGIRPVYRSKIIAGRQIKVKVGIRDGLAEDLEKHNEAALLGWLASGLLDRCWPTVRLSTRSSELSCCVDLTHSRRRCIACCRLNKESSE